MPTPTPNTHHPHTVRHPPHTHRLYPGRHVSPLLPQLHVAYSCWAHTMPYVTLSTTRQYSYVLRAYPHYFKEYCLSPHTIFSEKSTGVHLHRPTSKNTTCLYLHFTTVSHSHRIPALTVFTSPLQTQLGTNGAAFTLLLHQHLSMFNLISLLK